MVEWVLLALISVVAFYLQCRFFAHQWMQIRDQWMAIGKGWAELQSNAEEMKLAAASLPIFAEARINNRELN